MGFLSATIGVIALFVGWHRPLPIWWWVLLGILIFEFFAVAAVRESIKMHGSKSKFTVVWLVIATATQLSIIGISIWSFF